MCWIIKTDFKQTTVVVIKSIFRFNCSVRGMPNKSIKSWCLHFCFSSVYHKALGVLTLLLIQHALQSKFQMKATEQYFPVVLFNMLYKMVLTMESVDEILRCDHSNETTEQYFPVVLFIMLYKVVLTFESVDENLKCDHSNESY